MREALLIAFPDPLAAPFPLPVIRRRRAGRERLNALADRFRLRLDLAALPPINRHSAMLRAMGSADFVHPLRRDAHGIAAAFAVAFRLEQAGALFLGLIGWPVIAPAIHSHCAVIGP